MTMRRLVWCSAAAALAAASMPAGRAQQAVIRSSTDLISVDVQVVDRDGQPIDTLKADQFEVQIAGKKRAVRLVDFVRATTAPSSPGPSVPSPPGPLAPSSPGPLVPSSPGPLAPSSPGPLSPSSQSPSRRQMFMIAIDAQSFFQTETRGIVTTAQSFVRALAPGDIAGLFTYPLGPKVEPTTDRAALMAALDHVTGQREPQAAYQFNVRNSEIVDYFAEREDRGGSMMSVSAQGGRSAAGTTSIVDRYCAGDGACALRFRQEMAARAGLLEAQAHADLAQLRELIAGMAAIDGRKILVLVSAGLTISDRPGGRPDVGNLPIELGEACARANVSLYTLLVDNSVLSQFSAETRQGAKSLVNMARDADVAERSLDLFTGAAGGAVLKVLTGSGEQAFGRVLRETSAYYLLGVDATEADRTGRALPITVKVKGKGLTVRSRAWVVVPKGP
jgi:VWFA-related protein